jgi:fatty acid desaturase
VYFFAYLADSIRSFAEHSHPENDAAADEHRLLTYDSNPVERMLFAPMNMNYHAAHHLWVSIPYYNLPAADAEMRRHPLARELEWRTSYVGYLVRYALALPLEECRSKSAPLPEEIHS